MVELGVNIDHVATIREARKTYEPDPVWAATAAELGGAPLVRADLAANPQDPWVHAALAHILSVQNRIDEAFFASRIRAAIALRHALGLPSETCDGYRASCVEPRQSA